MIFIEARNLCLQYPLYSIQNQNFKTKIINILTAGKLMKPVSQFSTIKAIHNLNIRVEEGDRVGVIGHNGSGKTTFLKLLAGIYQSTSGELIISGKISNLFGLSANISEELSGSESLFIASLLRSKSYSKTKERFSRLQELTELGEHLNRPVRTYSAGMRLRIGFVVATDIEPEILLIDEVFATGDKDFMKKSREKMLELMDKTKILFLATHSEDLLRKFCNKAMLLSRGELVAFGEIDHVLDMYHSTVPL